MRFGEGDNLPTSTALTRMKAEIQTQCTVYFLIACYYVYMRRKQVPSLTGLRLEIIVVVESPKSCLTLLQPHGL